MEVLDVWGGCKTDLGTEGRFELEISWTRIFYKFNGVWRIGVSGLDWGKRVEYIPWSATRFG